MRVQLHSHRACHIWFQNTKMVTVKMLMWRIQNWMLQTSEQRHDRYIRLSLSLNDVPVNARTQHIPEEHGL